MEEEQGISAFPAQIRLARLSSRDELLPLAKERAFDPTVFENHEAFFWPALISNTRVDSYWTHMATSSLRNFASYCTEGVSFQNSHRWNELPLGASLTGRVEELESGLVQVVAEFYTLMGLQLNGISTDQFILGVRSGVVKDVSIGFSGGTRVCDICKQNYFRCSHWAGLNYEIEENGVLRQVRATVTVEDARLNEVSAVFDGATPGAVILKARAAAADGRLRGKEAEMLEQMYRVALPVTRRYAVPEVGEVPAEQPSQEDRTMGVESILDKHKIGMGMEEEARLAALDARITELLGVEAKLKTAEEALATANARVAELEPAAKDGQQYRADLIEEALAEGVRAKGDKFDQEKWGELLRSSSMTIDRVKLMRDDWKADGDARFPGGRHSADTHQPPSKEKKEVAPTIPARAYAV